MATPNLPTGTGLTDSIEQLVRDPIGTGIEWMRRSFFAVLKGTWNVTKNLPILPTPIGK